MSLEEKTRQEAFHNNGLTESAKVEKKRKRQKQRLPDDLKFEILSFLPDFVDRHEISHLNSEWYQISQKPKYWKNCCLDLAKLFYSHLILNKKQIDWIIPFCQLASHCTRLYIDLSIWYDSLMNVVETNFHRFQTQVKHLYFVIATSNTTITHILDHFRFFQGFPRLETLYINNTDLIGHYEYLERPVLPLTCPSLYLQFMGLSVKFTHLEFLRNVKHLTLDNCYLIYNKDFMTLDKQTQYFQLELESLTLEKANVDQIKAKDSYEFIHFIQEFITLCPKLKSLTAHDCVIDRYTKKFLQKCLPQGQVKLLDCLYEEFSIR